MLNRVDDAEFRRRMDTHVERGNELMAQNRAAFEENTRASNNLNRVLHLEMVALQRLLRDFELHSQDVRAEMRDVRAEMRAGREALFRMLGRFDGRGGEAPG